MSDSYADIEIKKYEGYANEDSTCAVSDFIPFLFFKTVPMFKPIVYNKLE